MRPALNLSRNPFEEHYLPIDRSRRPAKRSIADAQVSVMFSSDLDSDIVKWKQEGFMRVGLSDVLARSGDQGVTQEMREQALRVGADLVLFCAWPAKLRAVRRTATGEIDLEAVVADPPASFSSRGYSVARAVFLARRTT